MNKPKVNSEGQKELQNMQESFDKFEKEVRSYDPVSSQISPQIEEQTKLSTKELNQVDAPYIKPIRSINSKESANEKYAKQREKDWEYVKCVVENYEIIGEDVEMWTKEYAGDSAHFWRIPVNKAVYIPRLVARRISNCKYNKLVMQDKPTASEGGMQFYGSLVVEQTKQRLNARPVNDSFSVSSF